MTWYENIEHRAAQLQPELESLRMDFHRHPELGWEEYRTSRKIAGLLSGWGYEVISSKEVCGHETGVIGILRCGTSPGPVTALRFDIDALPVCEQEQPEHLPFRNGFQSQNPGVMHACGHDGHVAIGLGCAQLLSEIQTELNGTLKLIFQPSEEGARGALPITQRGWLDDVDYFLAGHIISHELARGEDANVIPGVSSSLATTKANAVFHGRSAHAAHPELGSDVIPAIADAVSAMHAMGGPGFIHTGTIHAGSGRNIIADYGKLELETRAQTTPQNEQLKTQMCLALQSAARKHGVACEIDILGSAPSLESTPQLTEFLRNLYYEKLTLVRPTSFASTEFPASEDAAHMMDRVKSHGGQASFLLFPARIASGLHNSDFDFPMELLSVGTAAFTSAAYAFMHQ